MLPGGTSRPRGSTRWWAVPLAHTHKKRSATPSAAHARSAGLAIINMLQTALLVRLPYTVPGPNPCEVTRLRETQTT